MRLHIFFIFLLQFFSKIQNRFYLLTKFEILAVCRSWEFHLQPLLMSHPRTWWDDLKQDEWRGKVKKTANTDSPGKMAIKPACLSIVPVFLSQPFNFSYSFNLVNQNSCILVSVLVRAVNFCHSFFSVSSTTIAKFLSSSSSFRQKLITVLVFVDERKNWLLPVGSIQTTAVVRRRWVLSRACPVRWWRERGTWLRCCEGCTCTAR